MTERILKASISTLEAFNDVRNEQSLAPLNHRASREYGCKYGRPNHRISRPGSERLEILAARTGKYGC